MRVLIACEYSATVRDAFRRLGYDAWSCDILPCDGDPKYHYQCDISEVIDKGWDLMIAHPPCTHLAVSGAKHFKEKIADGRQQAALDFVQKLMNAPIEMICIENPVSIISSKIRKPDQIVQPYQFGDPSRKTTCLWLKNLPPLKHTKVVVPNLKTYKDGSTFSADYGWSSNHKRNKTYQGIADAMAEQWGNLLTNH